MNKQRHRRPSEGGTSPETTPQTGSGVAHFSVSEVVQFSMSEVVQFSMSVDKRGGFRPFARRYANGEVHHFLRDRGFLIKVPPSWRELHARGRKLQGAGVAREAVARRLGVDERRWEEIERACSVGVVPLGVGEVG